MHLGQCHQALAHSDGSQILRFDNFNPGVTRDVLADGNSFALVGKFGARPERWRRRRIAAALLRSREISEAEKAKEKENENANWPVLRTRNPRSADFSPLGGCARGCERMASQARPSTLFALSEARDVTPHRYNRRGNGLKSALRCGRLPSSNSFVVTAIIAILDRCCCRRWRGEAKGQATSA